MAVSSPRRCLVIIFAIAFALNFLYVLTISSRVHPVSPPDWGIHEDFVPNITNKRNSENSENSNIEVSFIQETKIEKKEVQRPPTTGSITTDGEDSFEGTDDEKAFHEPVNKTKIEKTDSKEEEKKPKISKSLFFPRGVCGKKENLPQVIWETEEDVEAESQKHIATWFCNSTNPSSSLRLRVIKQLLDSLVKRLESSKLEYWIDRGTLLGSVRNASLIPWDEDADIGITYETFKQLILLSISKNLTFECDQCIFIFREGKHSHVIPFKFVNTTNGIYVDGFMYFRDDAKVGKTMKKRLVTYWPANKERRWIVDYDIVYPLAKKCTIDGTFYFCPKDSAQYTQQWYGPKWSKPSKPRGWKPS